MYINKNTLKYITMFVIHFDLFEKLVYFLNVDRHTVGYKFDCLNLIRRCETNILHINILISLLFQILDDKGSGILCVLYSLLLSRGFDR